MLTVYQLAAISLLSLLPLSAIAQEAVQPAAATKSEDQMIADAMWSVVDFETNESRDTQPAFELATKAYPESAKVAYWRGCFGAYTADRSRITRQIRETLKKLAEPQPEDANPSDPDLAQKMRSFRTYAKVIGERLQQRARDESNTEHAESYEVSLLDAVTHDPSMIAAWAKLAESSDQEIAFAAIDAWAEREPDNALPFYAKAIVLSRAANHSDPLDVAVIEALEEGNRRSDCRVPEKPWPVNFELSFPESLPDDGAEFAGQPVSHNVFRRLIENMFFELVSINGGSGVSEIPLRNLGSHILQQSHVLSRQEDARYLSAFVGVGLHMIDSNQMMFAITAGSVERVINRLANIAISRGDFQHADELVSLQDHVQDVQRKVIAEYRAAEIGEDIARNDREATQIMSANRREMTVPAIQFTSTTEPILVISDASSAISNDWAMMKLFLSGDHRMMVHPANQPLPDPLPNADALVDLGFLEVDQAIDLVRKSNLKNRRQQGIFLVSDSSYLDADIAGACYTEGYVGKRDLCIVAFTERESLESFIEYHPYMNVRTAQILSPTDTLDDKSIESVSSNADLVVVPLASLLNADGELLPAVKSSDLRFVVTGTDQETLMRAAKQHASIVGVIVSDILTR